jgi:RNA polymerase sigma-70 factor (ECF subfamily)
MSDDEGLFHAWRQGDRAAGQTLIAHHAPALERFFASKLPDQVDDLVQHTFLVCTEASTVFRGDGSFRAFLFGIARNVLHEHIRRRVRDGSQAIDFSQSSIMDVAPGVATLTHARDQQRVLLLALRQIPIDLQLILELHYREDMPIDELAKQLNVPTGTVKSRLHRARRLVAELLETISASAEEVDVARGILEGWTARDSGEDSGD